MSKERLFLCDVGEDDALPVLVAYTAQAAKLELGDVEKSHLGCFVVADCERGDLFLIQFLSLGTDVWELYQVRADDLQDRLIAVECDGVGVWKFESASGKTYYVASGDGPAFEVAPDEPFQLRAMQDGWSPGVLCAELKTEILRQLGVDETAEHRMNYQQGVAALEKVKRLAHIEPATLHLLGVLINSKCGALAALAGDGARATRTLGQQVVDELHRVLHELTGGQTYTGLLKPTPSEKLQAQLVTHDEGGQ